MYLGRRAAYIPRKGKGWSQRPKIVSCGNVHECMILVNSGRYAKTVELLKRFEKKSLLVAFSHIPQIPY
jgi:hypothetical protein